MSTLSEITLAADSLSPQEQHELFLLATRLHSERGALPPPRDIPKEQIEAWIKEDDAGFQEFLKQNG